MTDYGGEGFFNGFEPLKRYLSFSSGLKELDNSHQEKLGKAVSDWGFDTEDFHSLSSPTLVAGTENRFFGDESKIEYSKSQLYHDKPETYNDWGLSPSKLLGPKRITPVTMKTVFYKILTRFKSFEAQSAEFQDEFRYMLISSQLLDETILVSKYFTKKKVSSFKLNKKTEIMTRFGKVLWVNSNFSLNISDEQLPKLLNIIVLLKYLTKKHHFYSQRNVMIILIVVFISLLNILELRSFKIMLIQKTLLNDLKKIIKVYQSLDLLLQKFNNKYRELKLFSNMFEGNETNSQELDHILWLINFSSTTLSKSIYSKTTEILPITNKIELENYCDIYNVNITELSYILQENERINEMNDLNSIELINEKLKNFRYLRRFYLCCLLAIDDEFKITEETRFSSNILKLFQSNNEKECYPISLKLSMVSSNLKKLTILAESSKSMMDEYDPSSSNNLPTNTPDKSQSSDILMIIKELQSKLRFFDRNQSVENQVTEFTKVGDLIESLNTIFERDLSTLKKTIDKKPFNLTSSLSLKKTRESNLKKRYSMPISHQKSQEKSSARTVSLNQTQPYRRLSTGLSVPLLTLLEVEESHQKRTVSYDDNYINITPQYSQELEYKKQNDYISQKNLLSNDDSVVITSNKEEIETDDENDPDVTDDVLSEDNLKKALELKFESITTPTMKIPLNEITNIHKKNDQVNKNTNKYESDHSSNISGSLEFRNELEAALKFQTRE